MKTTIIGGTWEEEKGHSSMLVDVFVKGLVLSKKFSKISLLNGGSKKEFRKIIDSSVKDSSSLIWMPENLDELDYVKKICPEDIVIVKSEENSSRKLSLENLIDKCVELKIDIVLEMIKNNYGIINIRIIDSLGNMWNDFVSDYCDTACKLSNRISDIVEYRKNKIKTPLYSPAKPNAIEDNFNVNRLIKVIKDRFSDFNEVNKTKLYGSSSITVYDSSLGPDDIKDYTYSSEENCDLSKLEVGSFIRCGINEWDMWYGDKRVPDKNSILQLKLLSILPKFNFVLHTHSYINDAPFVKNVVMCGSMQEIKEIINIIKTEGLQNRECFSINLLGHGSTTVSKSIKGIDGLILVPRSLPEDVTSFSCDIKCEECKLK